jgi:hypothetical protein
VSVAFEKRRRVNRSDRNWHLRDSVRANVRDKPMQTCQSPDIDVRRPSTAQGTWTGGRLDLPDSSAAESTSSLLTNGGHSGHECGVTLSRIAAQDFSQIEIM